MIQNETILITGATSGFGRALAESCAKELYSGMNPITAEDIANIILWCIKLPSHLNINTLEVMPTSQTFGRLQIHR